MTGSAWGHLSASQPAWVVGAVRCFIVLFLFIYTGHVETAVSVWSLLLRGEVQVKQLTALVKIFVRYNASSVLSLARNVVGAGSAKQTHPSESAWIFFLLLIADHHIEIQSSYAQFDCSWSSPKFLLVINKIVDIVKITAFGRWSFLKLQAFLLFHLQGWWLNLGNPINILVKETFPLLIGHLPYKFWWSNRSHIIQNTGIVHAIHQTVTVLHILQVLQRTFIRIRKIMLTRLRIYGNPRFLIQNFVKIIFIRYLWLFYEFHICCALRILAV